MTIKKRSGQILVLVLLVVVVVLAVGLSVASRNLTNLKTSTQAEQSQRAFTAAEGGVENVLAKLNSVANVISGGPNANGCTSAGDGITANCTLPGKATDSTIDGSVTVKATKGYEKVVEPGEVAQVNLDTYAGSNINIQWDKVGDPGVSTLEFIFVCQGSSGDCMGDTMSNGYGQHRVISTHNPPASQQLGVGTFLACSDPGGDFDCSVSPDFTIPASGNVKILRIKPYWNRTTIKVTPTGALASSFPVQTYEITSTATTDTGVSRKVEVRREALPQLPAIFDYALYSGGDIVK